MGSAGWPGTRGGKEGDEPPAGVKGLYAIHAGRDPAVPYSEVDKTLIAALYKNYDDNVWIFPLAEKVKYALVFLEAGQRAESGQAIGADDSMEQFYFK